MAPKATMAPKGTKRAGRPPTQQAAPPTKVQKKVEEKTVEQVSDPLMDGLTDAIQRAELPEDCKEMLLRMTPCCFSKPTEERHEVQATVVRMVGEVITEMHSQMTKDVQEAITALESAEAEKTSLETTAVEAKSQLTVAGETVQSKEAGLQAATSLASEKQVLLEAARDAQTKGDAALVAAKQEKETFEHAVTNSIKVLHEPELEGHKAAEHYKIIQPLLSKLQLDESLLLALPSTCQKKPCDRGSFDHVIMDQLEKALNTHIAALGQQLDGGAAGAAERAAAVQAAEQDLSAANEAKETANKDLCTAQANQAGAVEFLKSSEQAVIDCKVRQESIITARDDKVKAQTSFETWNMSCFTQLRDKSTEPKEVTAEPKEVTAATDVEMAPKVAVIEETGNAPVTQAGA